MIKTFASHKIHGTTKDGQGHSTSCFFLSKERYIAISISSHMLPFRSKHMYVNVANVIKKRVANKKSQQLYANVCLYEIIENTVSYYA